MEKKLIELNIKMLKTASLEVAEINDYYLLLSELDRQLKSLENIDGQINDIF